MPVLEIEQHRARSEEVKNPRPFRFCEFEKRLYLSFESASSLRVGWECIDVVLSNLQDYLLHVIEQMGVQVDAGDVSSVH